MLWNDLTLGHYVGVHGLAHSNGASSTTLPNIERQGLDHSIGSSSTTQRILEACVKGWDVSENLSVMKDGVVAMNFVTISDKFVCNLVIIFLYQLQIGTIPIDPQ
jgi:hypothetical protein